MTPHVPLTVALAALTSSLGSAQESAAPFDAPVVLLEPGEPPFRRLLDFDADGNVDVVGAHQSQLRVWRGDGTGSLHEVWSETLFGGVGSIRHVERGDFNGDGLDDFVLAEDDGYRIHTSLGDGTFASESTVVTPDLVAVAVGDFDGDGKDDVAALKSQYPAPALLEIALSGGGVLHAATAFPFADVLRVLDADGDATDDLLVAVEDTFSEDSGSARLYLVGPASVTPGKRFEATPAYRSRWSTGDVDGDGDCDVVVFNEPFSGGTPDHFDLFERTGPATFVKLPNAPGGGGAEALADVDGDGDLDAVACYDTTFPGLSTTVTFESTLLVALNDGGLAFREPFRLPMLGAETIAGVADLDHDGDADLVAGACVYYARGPLTAPPMPEFVYNPFVFRDHMIGDVDGDGDPETALQTGVYNLGDGTFGPVPQPPFPAAPPGETVTGPNWFGDFTGDGAWDLVYTRYDSTSIPWTFLQQELVANAGGGGYVLAGPAAAPGHSFEPYENSVDNGFAADGDDDGDVDLFVRQSGRSTFYQNDGTGFFTAAYVFHFASPQRVADFNLDGHADVLARGNGTPGIDPRLYVYANVPGGSAPQFSAPTVVSPSILTEPEREVTVCDLNDDGWPDVAVVDQDGKPWVAFNTTATPGASPTFANPDLFGSAYPTDDDERPRVLGLDANGDGWTDLIVGPPDSRAHSVHVFVRKPGTTGVLTLADYEAPTLQVVPGLGAADVDGDGDVDLFGPTIAKNATHHPAFGGGARVQSVAPKPGTDGMVPILGATGPFREGSTTSVRLRGGLGGAVAVLVFAPHPAALHDFPLPGLDLYVDPFLPGFAQIPFVLSGPSGVGGAGAWIGPGFVVPTGLSGWTFYHQAFVVDPAAPSQVTQSNLLTLTYGG